MKSDGITIAMLISFCLLSSPNICTLKLKLSCIFYDLGSGCSDVCGNPQLVRLLYLPMYVGIYISQVAVGSRS